MNRMTRNMSSGVSSIGDKMRGNPIPLAMISMGIGWILLSRSGMDQRFTRSQTMDRVREGAGSTARYARDALHSATDRARDATDSVRDTASHLYERAGNAAEHASERISDAMGSVSDSMGGARLSSHPLGRRVERATSGFWELVDDHPFVAGIMGAALGAAIGASIPSTRYEEEWVGDYASQVTDKTKKAAQDALDRATAQASEIGQAATKAAEEKINHPT